MTRPVLAPTFALAVLLLAPGPRAGTLTVPGQFPTIQAAIDAAGPGDKVIVAPGNYPETVFIEAGKDGLQLVGKPGAVIDALVDGLPAGDALVVDADDVVVQGIEVRNAEGAGVDTATGIVVGGAGATLRRVRVVNGDGSGIVVTGADALLKDVTVMNAAFAGVDLAGAAPVARKLRVIGCQDGIQVESGASGARVRSCQVAACDVTGIVVSTVSDARVERCTTDGGNFGILLQSATASLVSRCTIRGTSQDGILTGGDGTGNLIERNTIEGCVVAMQLNASADGLVVRGNVVRRCRRGLEVVPTDGMLVEDNVLEDTAEEGILVFGMGAVLTGNRVTGAGEDGFDVNGIDARLEGNVAERCAHEGFELDGIGSTLLHNTSRFCHLDLAVQAGATISDFDGNTFTTGGLDVPPDFPD